MKIYFPFLIALFLLSAFANYAFAGCRSSNCSNNSDCTISQTCAFASTIDPNFIITGNIIAPRDCENRSYIHRHRNPANSHTCDIKECSTRPSDCGFLRDEILTRFNPADPSTYSMSWSLGCGNTHSYSAVMIATPTPLPSSTPTIAIPTVTVTVTPTVPGGSVTPVPDLLIGN